MEGTELTYAIAEVEKRLGVTQRTLRHYEDKLKLSINRDKSGNRIYNEADVKLLEKVRDMRAGGMELEGIRRLLVANGLIKEPQDGSLIIIDDKAMQLSEYLISSIGSRIASELRATNEKLDRVLEENSELRNEIQLLKRQSEDHYSKIDAQLSAWRNKKSGLFGKFFGRKP